MSTGAPTRADEVIERAIELRKAAIYPAELLILQPFDQAVLKLLWLLPSNAEFGMRGLIKIIQRLDWRTGNGRAAGEKAVRAALRGISDAGWIQISQPRNPDGTRAPQRYKVFEDRTNNPDWNGDPGTPVLAFPQVSPGVPMGEVVTVQPVDNHKTAGQSTCPIAAGGNGTGGDETGGSEDVSAGQSRCPNGQGGSPRIPPYNPPLGGEVKNPSPKPPDTTSPASAPGTGEKEGEGIFDQEAETLLRSLSGEFRVGPRTRSELRPLIAQLRTAGHPTDVIHAALTKPLPSNVRHLSGLLRRRLEDLPDPESKGPQNPSVALQGPSAPPWCGTCDPYGEHNPRHRMIETPAGLARCPACHPLCQEAVA